MQVRTALVGPSSGCHTASTGIEVVSGAVLVDLRGLLPGYLRSSSRCRDRSRVGQRVTGADRAHLVEWMRPCGCF